MNLQEAIPRASGRDDNRFLTLWAPGEGLTIGIARGSGIVGREQSLLYQQRPGRILVDFEGTIHGPVANIRTYADRVWHAAGRHMEQYPTMARQELPLASLVPVGRLWGDGIEVLDFDRLRVWLSALELAPELKFSDYHSGDAVRWFEEHPFWKEEP
jgi:hypothetical protein